ncbi:hypothetical protein AAU01_14610 [Paenarthrobacter aurescens]|uniref:Uncharacterized protein n=1 Tax=Paenarthrobacter aurescens TaxID=43663 RepID=A0A4Y3NHZ0_PAEAU|nr:hypothetical protein AAU01_14610 [Paenarthrobacter aurescens]
MGKKDRQGKLCSIGLSVNDLVDGAEDALAGIVKPLRIHDVRPMTVQSRAIPRQGAVRLGLDRRRLNGDLSLGLHGSPFSRGRSTSDSLLNPGGVGRLSVPDYPVIGRR